MEKLKMDINLDKYKTKQQEIINELKKDPNIIKFINDNDLNLSFIDLHPFEFKDYLDTLNECSKCNGLMDCSHHKKGRVLVLEYTNGLLDFTLKDCKHLKDYNNKISHQKNFKYCDMSHNQLMYSFNDIDFNSEDDDYLFLIRELKKIYENKEKKGVYLYGAPGVGKTFLASCLVNEFAKDNVKCGFVHIPTLIANLKNNMFDKGLNAKVLNSIKSCEVLVLDDIGGESASTWSRDDVILPLLNERMEKNLLTIFTSNYSLDKIEKFYALKSREISDSVGAKRVVERMKTLSLEKLLKGSSRR